jgi:hypothetical protein
LSSESVLSRAGRWFAHSGIQEANGGVARYYRTDLGRNLPVSTEITGYAVSSLLQLNEQERAIAAARFLCRMWDGDAMPFEIASPSSYFFDCGIIVRGLLASWRTTQEQRFLDVAEALGKAMIRDFAAQDGSYHPVIQIPRKEPSEGGDPLSWSRSSGCYQLKSALAWYELSEISGDVKFREAYERFLGLLLAGWRPFLWGHPEPLKTVDRLHAFLYFLEGLLPMAGDQQCAATLCEGIRLVPYHQQRTAATAFERSDVLAQLLRIRVFAAWSGVVPIEVETAGEEAIHLAEFQAQSTDVRVNGGFYFGRKANEWLPYVNPVSTAFAVQALTVWDRYSSRSAPADWRSLI